MDARKALFRAKLREQKQDKRIDSPLVRYNEDDQPVCRVCNVTLKSESLWAAHQASRRHHEAIQNLKAAASGKTSGSATKLDSTKELKKLDPSALPAESELRKNDGATDFQLSRAGESSPASTVSKPVKRALPEGFFDEAPAGSKPSNLSSEVPKSADPEVKKVKGNLPKNFFDAKEGNKIKVDDRITHSSKTDDGSDSNPIKGALPEGFFDNKDADLRARGIEPVKVDINDAYKEFEKEIQEDLQEVDDRLEEEEIDAAEVREEYESLEHKQYRERVEMVKKRLVEVRAARVMKGQQRPAFMGQDTSDESSSDSDEEENFAVDWRAKHL